jgi:transketolase
MLSESEKQKIQDLATCIRGLAMDGVQGANSGHPGMPMGCAEIGSVIWARHLRFSASDLQWPGRDRFVLSAGHGSMLLYSLLHLFDCGLSIEDLRNFRQWQSKTPGHPEFGWTPGVETTTGPLGQGFANGVGMAAASQMYAKQLSSNFFPTRVFGIVSDGDLMEGVASEAASLAGTLKLGNLNYVYDDNDISIGGSTDLCFTEDVGQRFLAYGWHVQHVDGHNVEEIDAALSAATKVSDKPSLVIAKTIIGKGSPGVAGSADSHGSPLGAEEIRKSKQSLGLDPDQSFQVDENVRTFCQKVIERNLAIYTQWQKDFAPLLPRYSGRKEIPDSLREQLFEQLSAIEKDATRNTSGKAIQLIAAALPAFVGGSADLEPSNKTLIKADGNFSAADFSQRNIRFGVREHAMGAFVNGMAYHGGFIPYGATFLVFADYVRPSIRLAALSHLHSLFIFTHDSFWVGEDGPTHQPIEHIEGLRSIPNLRVYRPADGAEVAAAYWRALSDQSGPSALLFTRQNLTRIDRSDPSPTTIMRGGYIVSGEQESQRVIIATGSELELACEVAALLKGEALPVRVVSMPCVEDFLRQDAAYQQFVLPQGAQLVSIEAGITSCWKGRFAGIGLTIGIDHYGASAPGEELARHFGFEAESIARKVRPYFA